MSEVEYINNDGSIVEIDIQKGTKIPKTRTKVSVSRTLPKPKQISSVKVAKVKNPPVKTLLKKAISEMIPMIQKEMEEDLLKGKWTTHSPDEISIKQKQPTPKPRSEDWQNYDQAHSGLNEAGKRASLRVKKAKDESLLHNGAIIDPREERAAKYLKDHNITAENAHTLTREHFKNPNFKLANPSKARASLSVKKAIYLIEGYTPMDDTMVMKSFNGYIPNVMKDIEFRPPQSWWEQAIVKSSQFEEYPETYSMQLWYGNIEKSEDDDIAKAVAEEIDSEFSPEKTEQGESDGTRLKTSSLTGPGKSKSETTY